MGSDVYLEHKIDIEVYCSECGVQLFLSEYDQRSRNELVLHVEICDKCVSSIEEEVEDLKNELEEE